MDAGPLTFWASQPRAIARAAKLRYFFPGKVCAGGHLGWWFVSGGCVICAGERKVQWVKDNPERARAYGRKHYLDNASDYKSRAAKWKADNPDLAREMANARKPNAEKRRLAAKRLRMKEPERFRASVRNRKAQRRGAVGAFTLADCQWIERKQRGLCAYCRCKLTPKNKELDHIIAITAGGTNFPRNLQYLCRACNRSKGPRDPITFAQTRGLLL
jgi:hypothetical protein